MASSLLRSGYWAVLTSPVLFALLNFFHTTCATTGATLWSYSTGNYVWSTAAFGSDGTVFVGSSDGSVYALSTSGALLWQYKTYNAVLGKLAVSSDGDVFFGTGNSVYSVDGSTGVFNWDYSTGSDVYGGVATDSYRVYFGSEDACLYAVYASSGILSWTYCTYWSWISTPVLSSDGSTVHAVDSLSVYAVYTATGSEKWKYNSGLYDCGASVAVGSDGTVFLENYVTMYALDGATGAAIWSTQVDYTYSMSPVVDTSTNTVFVGSYSNPIPGWYNLNVWPSLASDAGIVLFGYGYSSSSNTASWYAFDGATGSALWRFSGPTTDYGGYVYAVDTLTGSLQWKVSARVMSTALSNGVLYVGTEDNQILAISATQAPTAAPSTATPTARPTPAPTHAPTLTPCPAGRYSNASAGSYLQVCVDCPQGYYSHAGATSCIACAMGSYAPYNRTETCTDCPGGTFSTVVAATSSSVCQNCSAGSFSAAGSQSCTPCPPGSYGPEATMSSCILCAAGKYSAVTNATSAEVCQNCSAGFYSQAGDSSCTACPAGTFSNSSGQTSASCKKCDAGYYSTEAATTCIACPAGFYSQTGDSSCTACPAGTVSDFSGQASVGCRQCDAGYYSSEASTTCIACSAGYVSSADASACYKCTIPSHCIDGTCVSGYTGKNCLACDVGYYLDGSGYCSQCSRNYYTDIWMIFVILALLGIVMLALYMLNFFKAFVRERGVRLSLFFGFLGSLTVCAFFPVPWPGFVHETLNVLSLYSLTYAAVECHYHVVLVDRVYLSWAAVFGVCVLAWVVDRLGCPRLLADKNVRSRAENDFRLFFFQALSFAYQWLLHVTATLLRCVPATGGPVLQFESDVYCDSGVFIGSASGAIILLLVVGPLYPFLLYYAGRLKAKDANGNSAQVFTTIRFTVCCRSCSIPLSGWFIHFADIIKQNINIGYDDGKAWFAFVPVAAKGLMQVILGASPDQVVSIMAVGAISSLQLLLLLYVQPFDSSINPVRVRGREIPVLLLLEALLVLCLIVNSFALALPLAMASAEGQTLPASTANTIGVVFMCILVLQFLVVLFIVDLMMVFQHGSPDSPKRQESMRPSEGPSRSKFTLSLRQSKSAKKDIEIGVLASASEPAPIEPWEQNLLKMRFSLQELSQDFPDLYKDKRLKDMIETAAELWNEMISLLRGNAFMQAKERLSALRRLKQRFENESNLQLRDIQRVQTVDQGMVSKAGQFQQLIGNLEAVVSVSAPSAPWEEFNQVVVLFERVRQCRELRSEHVQLLRTQVQDPLNEMLIRCKAFPCPASFDSAEEIARKLAQVKDFLSAHVQASDGNSVEDAVLNPMQDPETWHFGLELTDSNSAWLTHWNGPTLDILKAHSALVENARAFPIIKSWVESLCVVVQELELHEFIKAADSMHKAQSKFSQLTNRRASSPRVSTRNQHEALCQMMDTVMQHRCPIDCVQTFYNTQKMFDDACKAYTKKQKELARMGARGVAQLQHQIDSMDASCVWFIQEGIETALVGCKQSKKVEHIAVGDKFLRLRTLINEYRREKLQKPV